MLNEERIKLMTKMASYEENEGKGYMSIGSFFRSDYISLQVMKSIISATISFAIVFGIWVFYNFESVMKEIYQVDLLGMGKNILLSYVIFAGIYAVISYVVYSYRYSRAKNSLKKYFSHLQQMSQLYEEENRK